MSNNSECAKYFKSQKVFDRCFKAFWEKWRSYGKVAGRITLKDASEEERKAVSGIIGKALYGEKLQFSFAEFESGLQKTRFAPVDMKIILEEYFEKKLQTSQREREEKENQKKIFLKALCNYFQETAGKDSTVVKWLEALISEKKYGYQSVIRRISNRQIFS